MMPKNACLFKSPFPSEGGSSGLRFLAARAIIDGSTAYKLRKSQVVFFGLEGLSPGSLPVDLGVAQERVVSSWPSCFVVGQLGSSSLELNKGPGRGV